MKTLSDVLTNHSDIHENENREQFIQHVLDQKEAMQMPNGALATWTEPISTGRIPKDTFIVRRPEIEDSVDWTSSACNALDPEKFETLWKESLELLEQKDKLFVTDRVIGADASYELPVKTVSDRATTALFSLNMFRKPQNQSSVFADRAIEMIILPYDKIEKGFAREGADAILAIDLVNNRALVRGSLYLGMVKKTLFTILNYLAPEKGILPLHCSANVNEAGETAVLLGLSGTGKTTLSADPARKLIGDDEHGWGDRGIANFENGCYAKLIDLNPKKEPEIFRIAFGDNDPQSGVLIENAMVYPNGTFDLYDSRLTQNSRTSYPMTALKNFEPSAQGGHPKTILFLTADANGVLPPVSKLDKNQAMLWFVMGYTSKLAGTEAGVTSPKSAFSRFFGEPFMPRHPQDYAELLKEKINKFETNVYLINTGWSGGAYGVGERMDIMATRSMVEAALSGDLENVEYEVDKRFHLNVPKSCPNVDSQILNPKNTWADKEAFEATANKLAQDFRAHFEKNFADLPAEIRDECPGF